ncbi:hypothetical protein L612_005200000050 [Rhodococcus rhodochrous J38]|uniref:hypothetical protein n=1 Tax=Rhodococcus rhodochrous TaxID=1829 RepID=UPI0011A6CAAA|nr:hypothetical protein [Rhodococcus rhodochrous]TWH41271.1 hypothetical protein L612_005200000050 [Rhodococcus rhodochrous J38]
MSMKRIVGAAAAAVAATLTLAPQAGAWTLEELVATGSAALFPPAYTGPIVVLGDYCQAHSEPARTADGRTAYCVRVQFTDAYVWSDRNELQATDPHFPVSPGDVCLDANAVTIGTGQRTMYCNPTQNGRNRGNLVWQLQP